MSNNIRQLHQAGTVVQGEKRLKNQLMELLLTRQDSWVSQDRHLYP